MTVENIFQYNNYIACKMICLLQCNDFIYYEAQRFYFEPMLHGLCISIITVISRCAQDDIGSLQYSHYDGGISDSAGGEPSKFMMEWSKAEDARCDEAVVDVVDVDEDVVDEVEEKVHDVVEDEGMNGDAVDDEVDEFGGSEGGRFTVVREHFRRFGKCIRKTFRRLRRIFRRGHISK